MKTMTSSEVRLPIMGATYPATTGGFKKFLAEANIRWTEGYRLMSLVKIEKKMAAVFVLADAAPGANPSYSSFAGEEDEDPVPTYR